MIKMGRKKVIPVRMSDSLYKLVKEYALFMDLKYSEALRELIKEGLVKKSYMGLLRRWKKLCGEKNAVVMKVCEKCKDNKGVQIYHIDGNVINWNAENLVVLCESCLNKLRKAMQEYNAKEEFISWFFLSP